MIFKFNEIKKSIYSMIIKSSFGRNITGISEYKQESNEQKSIINITKKKKLGSLKLTYELKNDNFKKDLFVNEFFRLNNLSNYKIIFNNKEYQYLHELYDLTRNKEIKVKFALLNSKINLRSMFENNITLKSISGNITLNDKYIYDLSNMFSGCFSLKSLSDVSIYNLNKVNNLNKMFYNCDSLNNIFDLSKIDTSYVFNMSYIFSKCHNLISLPDISNWNTENVKNMSHMFEECIFLKSLPDISKWNILNVKSLNHLFEGCLSLEYLPDISKWNTENVTNMSHLFSGENYYFHKNWEKRFILERGYDSSGLGEIIESKIDDKLYHMKSSLLELPDISKWNLKNIKNISYMFNNCEKLKSLPDISNWDTSNITNMSFLFSFCRELLSLPDISK